MGTLAEIVVLSLEPWGAVRRRIRILVEELAARDPSLRFAYIEPPLDLSYQLRSGRLEGLRELRGRRREALGGQVEILQPLKLLPRALGPLADLHLGHQVVSHLRRLGFRHPVAWVNDANYADFVASQRWPAVYDITDDWLASSISPRERKRLAARESRLLSLASEVVVCSPNLAASKGSAREVWLIPNGVDRELFQAPTRRPEDLPPGRCALYVGTLHEDRLDVELCLEAARSLPQINLVLVGPDCLSEATRRRLMAEPNVFLLGPRPYLEVPSYLQHADVVVVPHRLTPFTESLDPIKAYECMAVGTPTVATPVAGFRDLGPPVVVAEPGRFIAALKDVLDRRPPRDPRPMPTWRERAEQFRTVLEAAAEGAHPEATRRR